MKPFSLKMPPRRTNPDGETRRVGVELEFAAVSARDGSRQVQSLFGGTIEEEDPHRFHIRGTDLGDFVCELDSQYVHRPLRGDDSGIRAAFSDFEARLRALIGDVSAVLVPCEVVCPPVPIDELGRIETLVEALRAAGAEGTRSNPLYAFGAQLNPEIAEDSGEWIASVLKAYLLLSEWLREIMSIDPTRRIASFADPFPNPYVLSVVDPDYWPDRDRLIEDYLHANPTRNRELDLLPLFAFFDEEKVKALAPDPLIKKRPTFHYRLPDARFSEPDWGVTLEWNRWCVVEELAADRAKLDAMGRAYRANREQWISENWAIRASEWLLVS
ncbi:amidoligase family protein [Rhodobium gokarnense]|uniref:Amidoligase enzyme n=1 Tax=Rhodobium gokarnense TaxID=364296 RepID=A0ABT3HI93_9HYPH|nr:amidoligase family protein [Rhodobium gokarnense]MCW2310137.1 hypothetical protein [Rhodobium gokarnense]